MARLHQETYVIRNAGAVFFHHNEEYEITTMFIEETSDINWDARRLLNFDFRINRGEKFYKFDDSFSYKVNLDDDLETVLSIYFKPLN